MAEKKEKAAKPAKDSGALKKQIEAILHSNGFDGMKCAGEIVAAVETYTGENLSDKKEEETEE